MLLSTFVFFSAVCEDSFPIKGRFKVRVRLKVRVRVKYLFHFICCSQINHLFCLFAYEVYLFG